MNPNFKYIPIILQNIFFAIGYFVLGWTVNFIIFGLLLEAFIAAIFYFIALLISNGSRKISIGFKYILQMIFALVILTIFFIILDVKVASSESVSLNLLTLLAARKELIPGFGMQLVQMIIIIFVRYIGNFINKYKQISTTNTLDVLSCSYKPLIYLHLTIFAILLFIILMGNTVLAFVPFVLIGIKLMLDLFVIGAKVPVRL